ncbi:spatacsin-like [Patiria miniata]|uniref:Spatacsin C-terminal domain-containing protein n=1 Tax=Patiria miniata TaxID=46514 RepID=A0A914BK95_PATMI|nr:spatacsin-like [Patiria miniata]
MKMAVSTPSFSVSLQKVTNSIKPEQIINFHYVSSERVFVVHRKNGDVVVINVGDDLENSTIIAQDVLQFRLLSGRRTRDSTYTLVSFLALQHGPVVSVYNVSLETGSQSVVSSRVAMCTTEQLGKILHKHSKSDLPDVSHIHLLAFESSSSSSPSLSTATILCGSILLELSLWEDKEPEAKECSALVWDPKVGSIVQCKMLHGLVFLLHQSGNITVHSLSRKMAVASIHFHKFLHHLYPNASMEVLKPLHPECLDVSPDLRHLILTQRQAKFNIYKISLNEYFAVYPYHVKVQRSGRSLSQGAGSRRDGDEDEIAFMHGGVKVQREGEGGNQSWLNVLASASRLLSRSGKTPPHQADFSQLSPDSVSGATANWFERVGLTELMSSKSGTVHREPGDSGNKQEKISGFGKPRHRHESVGSYRPKLVIKKREDEADLALSPSAAIRATKAFRDLEVAGMFVTRTSAVIWYRGNAKLEVNRGRYGGVCLVDLRTNDMDYFSFAEPVVVSFSPNSSHPHLLLSNGSIEALAYGVDQETLVNKLMIYSSASLAETVCHLNHWDHYSIPIHALEIGLKQRQLDTVAFFLKSRENVFRYCPSPSSPARMGSPRTPSPPTADQTQLWPALDLLMASIRAHAREHQSRQYALQLLNLTLAYVNRLVQNASETAALLRSRGEDELGIMEGLNLTEEVLEGALQRLQGYVRDMWVYLKGCPKWIGAKQEKEVPVNKDEVDSGPRDLFLLEGQIAEKQIKKWRKMQQEEVIKDAILKRCLPLAQAYLCSCHGGSGVKVQMSDLIEQGLHLMLNSLLNADLKTATKMLQHMGYDVNAQLKKMCLYTANHNLRNFLIDHLSQSGQFTPEEEGMITFIHQLEHLYTCQSFERAKALALESGKRTWAGIVPPKQSLNFWAQNFMETRLQRGELVNCEPPNCENFHYAHIVLEWVRTWDQELRERVLLDVLLNSKDTSFRPHINPKSTWRYLTAHADSKHLVDWITASLPRAGSRTTKPEHLSPVLAQPLFADGADDLEGRPGYVREKILDELASRGIFSSTELSKFDFLLTRLGRTLQLYADPSSLHGDGDMRERFNQWFIEMCLKEELPNVLYLYFDFYGLYLSENEVISMQPPLSDCSWLEMLLHFRWVGRQTTDPSLMFQASLSNSQLLLGNSQPTVSQLVASYPLVALATLIFAPGTFSEAMTPATTVEERLWKVDAEVLETALKAYPKLQTAVFPPIDVDGVSQQDITVYQLLQGNCPYDPARLFKWQTTNPMVNKRDRTEMPHFSQQYLTGRYAYSETFRFTYYLYQGRPSFAYLAFLASQLQGGGTPTKKKLLAAHLKAYCTAIKHFSNRTVAAACVAFVEMLGQDSLSIRIDLQAALTILEHTESRGGGGAKTRKDKEQLEQNLVKRLLACLQGSKSNAEEVLRLLEVAITSKLNLIKVDLSSWEASEEWSLAIHFCRRHKLPLSAVYPAQCASDNQWLHFTCFVQGHQYPKQQVLDLLPRFRSTTIREHLQDAFRNLHRGPAILRDDQPSSVSRPVTQSGQRSRDIKAHYYQRVGFLRRQNTDMSSEDDTTCGSEDAMSPDEGVPQIVVPEELDINRVPKDLFGVLFDCNTTPIPWKSLLAHAVALREPILAVIAACYKDCVTLDCLCTWLLTSLDDPTSVEKVTESMASVQWHSWTLDELATIVEVAMTTGLVTLLAKGFYIFDKDCAMNPFLNFCEAMLVKCDTSQAKTCLQDFHTAILKCRRKGIVGSGTHSPRPVPAFKIGDLRWYEDTASSVVYSMVAGCSSYWDTFCLLEVLAHANFSRIVSRQVPDYNKLYKMTQALTDTPIHANITCLLEGTEYMDECHRVLESLKEAKLLQKAKEFASVAGLPVDQVIVEQLLCKLARLQKSKVWFTEAGRMIFWKSCHNSFKANSVSGRAVSKFFKSQVKEQRDLQAREKASLLSLAHRWLVKETTTSPEHKAIVEGLQQEAWRWRLTAEVEKMDATPVPPSLLEGAFNADRTEWFDEMDFKRRLSEELLYIANVEVDAYVPPILKDEKEVRALNLILGQLLDKCCIRQAHRLAKQFNHPHQDLAIILTSIQLASAPMGPSELEPEMRRLVVAAAGSGLGAGGIGGGVGRGRTRKTSEAWRGMMSKGMLTRSASTVSVSSLASLDPTEDPEELDEILTTIEALCGNCSSQARQCCDRIINAYRIAQVLSSSYRSVVVQAPFDSLRSILRCRHPQRFALAKTFILANEMTDAQVAGFLCEAVITSLKTRQPQPRRREGGLSSRLSSASLSSYMGQELGDREEFSQVIQLCRNPAILGNRLLQEATSLVSSDIANTKSVYTMEVELIIRAHDCHTVCCNMEGISNVLRKCRECSNALAFAEEYGLLVRLLTGVGRYCEMSYILDVLRSNQQIELLLKRGGKDDNLKVALLDYLKRCDPPDTEAYNFVAVKFEMNREIAELLERDAHEQLKGMSKKTMDANIELQNSLQVILQDFTKAAQSYAKDNCLRHAEQCIKQARLVALQLHLLPTKTQVMNLDSKALGTFMMKHQRFHEALIVSDAYGSHTHWPDAIYHNVVIQGDFKYLEDYSKCIPLNDALFRDVANKYRQGGSRTYQPTSNMKKLLGYCDDVLTAYKIATELSFQDIALSLLESDAGAYLKDVA